VVLAAGLTLAAPAALAQPSEADTAAARALFTEGRALAQQEDWPAAVDRFRRALALRPSPAIRFNLAASLVRVGRLVEASELARAVLREAPARDPARAPAEALLREIEPKIVQLTIRLQAGAEDATVLLDGSPFAAARVGVATPVDPGPHTIVARRGLAETTRRVDLAPGSPAEVTLALPPPPAAPAIPAAPTEMQPSTNGAPEGAIAPVEPVDGPEPRSPHRASLRWPLLLAGAGLVGGGVALDLAPASARNGETDVLDFVPVGLYLAGAIVGVVGVLQD